MEYPSNENPQTSTESIDMSEFDSNFLTLRIGEEIEDLKVKEIKKVSNTHSSNNLPGVDYKYLIVSDCDEVLTVNSWVFFNTLKKAIQEHNQMPQILSLKHPAEKVYEITVVE